MKRMALFSLCGIPLALIFWIMDWIFPTITFTFTGKILFGVMELVVPIFFTMFSGALFLTMGIDKLTQRPKRTAGTQI
jgi:hypothetical protein